MATFIDIPEDFDDVDKVSREDQEPELDPDPPSEPQ